MMTTGEKLLNAYIEKRKEVAANIRIQKEYINGLRSNSKHKPDAIGLLERMEESENNLKEKIHQLDSFTCLEDEYIQVDEQISSLCKRRDEMLGSLLQSEYRLMRRDGQIHIH